MNRAGGADRPEDVDAAFAEIVSELRAEGVGEADSGELGAFNEGGEDDAGDSRGDPGRSGESVPAREGTWRTGSSEWEDVLLGDEPAGIGENEHFVPPEPPPLPRPGSGAFVVLLFFIVGLMLLITPALLGVPETVSLPLGLLSLLVAIGLVLLRIRRRLPDDHGPDDGAQV